MLRRILSPVLLLALCSSSLLAADPPAVEEGVRLFRQRRFDEARAALAPLARAQPPNATAVFTMGRIALARDDPKEAARWFEAAVGLDAQSSTCHMWLGRAYGTQAQRAGKLSQDRAREEDQGRVRAGGGARCSERGRAMGSDAVLPAGTRNRRRLDRQGARAGGRDPEARCAARCDGRGRGRDRPEGRGKSLALDPKFEEAKKSLAKLK